MKICHVINSLGNGGAEKNLVRLSLYQSKNNIVTIISLKEKNFFKESLRKKNIKIITFDFSLNFKLFKNLIKFAKILKREKPDKIFSWMFHSSLLATVFALMFNITIFWCIRHGTFNIGKTKFFTLIIGKFLLPLISSVPKKIIYNSRFSKKYYEDLGYNKKKSLLIYNGFSKDFFKPNNILKNKFKKKYKIKKNQVIFGYVARFNPQKNHHFLFKNFYILKKSYQINFKIILVGGNIKNNKIINELIKKFDLKKHIVILSETNKINSIYPIFDINLMLSSYGESFPNTVAESMLCGVPNIASKVGDSSNIVNKSGYLFESNNNIKFRVCVNKSLDDLRNIYKWKLKKVNCRKFIIKNFDIKKMFIKYDKIKHL